MLRGSYEETAVVEHSLVGTYVSRRRGRRRTTDAVVGPRWRSSRVPPSSSTASSSRCSPALCRRRYGPVAHRRVSHLARPNSRCPDACLQSTPDSSFITGTSAQHFRYVTKPTRSTQPCIHPGSLNRVRASIGLDKGGNVTSAGMAGNTV